MDFAINYVSAEAMLFLKLKDNYIKYPGMNCNIETLKELIEKRYKIVLHGLVPSSGSITDPHLCDHIEEFAKLVKITNQRWLSFHLDYKSKYISTDFDVTIRHNISEIRKYCGENIPILIENVPPIDNCQDWFINPEIISQYCEKYDLGFLLDIPHAIVAANSRGEQIEKYLSKLPLNKVREIHISGFVTSPEGSLKDAHTECNYKVYKVLEYVLYKTPGCEMITIEYCPKTNFSFLGNMEKIKKYKDICVSQQFQLTRVRSIAQKVKKETLNS